MPCNQILEEGSSLANVRMFIESDRAARQQKLLAHLDFIVPAFDDFQGLLDTYARECPLAAYHSIAADAERWLGWVESRMDLSPEQRDYLACQRARLAVETVVRRIVPEHPLPGTPDRRETLWPGSARKTAFGST